MFGTSPAAVETSLQNYCMYFSSIIELEFSSKNNKAVKSTTKDVLELLNDFLVQMMKIGMLYSIVDRYGYAPFGENESMFDLRHLGNNFFVACESMTLLFTVTASRF
jgi:hypothetical protein